MELPSEQTIKVEGVEYRLSKFTFDLYQEFLDWSKAVLPDPFAGLADRINGLAPELQRYAFDKAEARAALRGTMNDPEVQELLNSPRGAKKAFWLMFRKHHPQLTEDQVGDIVEKGVAEHGDDLFAKCFPSGDGAA